MLKKLTTFALLAALLLTGANVHAQGGDESYDIKEVIAAKENYDYIRSLMVMMNESRDLQEINKVVFEVEKYVEIAENLLEVAKIFYEDEKGGEMTQMRRIVARTHLLLVSFYLYQKNYTGAVEHFRLAEEVYPELDTDAELEIEVKANRDRVERYVVRYEMNDVQKFRSRFQGDVQTAVEFEVEVDEALDSENLTGVNIRSLNVLAEGTASYRLLELANNAIAEELAKDLRFFRLTLSPGEYEVTQDQGLIFPQRFTISEVEQEQFTLFLQPDSWFSLQYADNYRKNPPELYYNGILITEDQFDKLPYGEYEVRADPKHFDFEFGKIVFTPASQLDGINYGPDFVEIPVTEQSKYILDLGKRGVFSRLGDTTVD